MPSLVSIARGMRSASVVEGCMNQILPRIQLKGKRLLVKVNLTHRGNRFDGVATDPTVVEAIHNVLSDRFEEIVIAESDATSLDALGAAKSSGLLLTCQRLGLNFVNLSKEKDRVRLKVPKPHRVSEFEVPKVVLDSVVVSAAKMKTHSDTTVTLSIKNLFGLLPERFKAKYHILGISQVLADLFQVVKPALSIVEGFSAMEGAGPIGGNVIAVDTIISASDALAADWVTAMVMGFDPRLIYHLAECAKMAPESIEEMKILGESLESAHRKFKFP